MCLRIGIPPSRLTRRNASHYGDYRRYYDEALLAQVSAFYRADFEQFDYPIAETPEALA